MLSVQCVLKTNPYTRISLRTSRKTTWSLCKIAPQSRKALIFSSCTYLILGLCSLQWSLPQKNGKAHFYTFQSKFTITLMKEILHLKQLDSNNLEFYFTYKNTGNSLHRHFITSLKPKSPKATNKFLPKERCFSSDILRIPHDHYWTEGLFMVILSLTPAYYI